MPYLDKQTGRLHQDGLYHVRRYSSAKGIWHDGILDVGNRLLLPEVHPAFHGGRPPGEPVVVHNTPPRINAQWLSMTGTDGWHIIGNIPDVQRARWRLSQAMQNADYAVVTNNCEHFANNVAYGRRESPQLKNAWRALGLGLAVYAVFRL